MIGGRISWEIPRKEIQGLCWIAYIIPSMWECNMCKKGVRRENAQNSFSLFDGVRKLHRSYTSSFQSTWGCESSIQMWKSPITITLVHLKTLHIFISQGLQEDILPRVGSNPRRAHLQARTYWGSLVGMCIFMGAICWAGIGGLPRNVPKTQSCCTSYSMEEPNRSHPRPSGISHSMSGCSTGVNFEQTGGTLAPGESAVKTVPSVQQPRIPRANTREASIYPFSKHNSDLIETDCCYSYSISRFETLILWETASPTEIYLLASLPDLDILVFSNTSLKVGFQIGY